MLSAEVSGGERSFIIMVSYISLFSGAGGLESADSPPVLCCDLEVTSRTVLEDRFPAAEIHDDVTTLSPPKADVVAGGWPCQDLSVAGNRRGLNGERSGLFFELLRVARESKATTIVAENVPNLLTLDKGETFLRVLRSLADEGFDTVAWRTLNARQFHLPHQRRRVFIVASKDPSVPPRLHRPIKRRQPSVASVPADAFYTTAGIQSICFSEGFVPTLKVGSSLSIPSPPGVLFGDCVRKATANECLALQGFDPAHFSKVSAKDKYRLAGNAVAVPVGQFVMETVNVDVDPEILRSGAWKISSAGLCVNGQTFVVDDADVSAPLSQDLGNFLDVTNREPLSTRASAGLLRRLDRSGKPCPERLRWLLEQAAQETYEPAGGNSELVDSAPPDDPRVPALF